MLESQSKA